MGDKDSKSNEIIGKVEILSKKRQRTFNRTDTVATTWILEHLEECEQANFALCDAYENYLDWCREYNNPVLLKNEFAKVIKKLFERGFGLKTSSPLYALVNIRVRNRRRLPEPNSISRLEKAILDVLQLEEYSTKGMRISSIKHHLTSRFPMESFDSEALKKFLDARVGSGMIQRVKNIGKIGFYRLNAADPDSELDKEADVEENVDDSERDDSSDSYDPYNSDKDNEANGEETSRYTAKEAGKKSTEKTKRLKLKKKGAIVKKAAKNIISKKGSAYKLIHGKPTRVEDTFPLAMCFCCEPKLAGISKISNYLERYYNISLPKNKLRSVLNSGVSKGYWSKTTRKSTLGKVQLEISEFDPTNDNDLVGKIINAILACNEPKECSVQCLKQYADEFHPNFNIMRNPLTIRRALKNAEEMGLIKRMSGVGASGTFRLNNSFTPSPVQLAGNDRETDYEDDTNGSKSLGQSVFCDARKSKRSISGTSSRMTGRATKNSSSNGQSRLRTRRKVNSSARELLRSVRSSKRIKMTENCNNAALKPKSDIKKELDKMRNVSIKAPRRILRTRPASLNRNKNEASNSVLLNRRRGRSAACKQNL